MSHPNFPNEAALIKEVCRRIRVARSYWDAHNNAACRHERDRALALYQTLTPDQKAKIPDVLRVWLRYRSEKYFGSDRTPPRQKPDRQKPDRQKPDRKNPGHKNPGHKNPDRKNPDRKKN